MHHHHTQEELLQRYYYKVESESTETESAIENSRTAGRSTLNLHASFCRYVFS